MPARQARTGRLLEARLEELARACERSPAASRRAEEHAAALSAATEQAVALDLLSVDDARAIWASVAGRHPDAAWCRTHRAAA